MTFATQQQLVEIIEVADISVRVASQLRMVDKGRKIGDLDSIQSAEEFLNAAIEGGRFVSSGVADNFQSTLRPFNWAADVRLPVTSSQKNTDDQLKDYTKVVSFLGEVRDVLAAVSERKSVEKSEMEKSIGFFETLGELLGTRADQSMRHPSSVFSLNSFKVG